MPTSDRACEDRVQFVQSAEPIRPYGPPAYLVWTAGQPCSTLECRQLTTALQSGEIDIVELGRWGPYNAIGQWHRGPQQISYLLELRHNASQDDQKP